MEHGGSSFHRGQPEKSISSSKQLQEEGDCSSKNKQVVVEGAAPHQENQNLPIPNVVRIVRHALPPNAEISDETKITMVQCATQFISLITSEAKRRCQSEQRPAVTEEDLLWAMKRLGLNNYAAFCTLYSAYRGGPVPAQPAVIANDSVPPPLSTASDAPTEKDESGASSSSSGSNVYRLP